MKHLLKLSLILLLQISIFIGEAQTPKHAYIVKEGDWLSEISAKVYGNPHLYYRIIEGTNKKHFFDKSFQKISNVKHIKAGQKLWIPNYSRSEKENQEFVLVSIPRTNYEIRIWYNFQVIAISELNKNWILQNIDLETRAKKAYQLRHNARVNARFMMADKQEVRAFQKRDQEKYGNPHGPTFEYLLKKNKDLGFNTNEAYQKIIESASQVSKVYNSECKN